MRRSSVADEVPAGYVAQLWECDLGQNNTTDLVVEDGIVVDKASATFVAGTIASNGAAITLHNISLNADTLIDTTNGGLNTTGAEILLKESITFNAHTLTTDGGARDTDFRGNMTLQNGTLDVTRGDVNLGESGNATTRRTSRSLSK